MSSMLSLRCHPTVTPVTAIAFLEDWLLYGRTTGIDSTNLEIVLGLELALGLVLGSGKTAEYCVLLRCCDWSV